jgi:arsenate reductase
MKEVVIDISGHSSNHLNEYINEDFDYVITVCDNAAANCPAWPKETTRLHWPFPDPAHATGTESEILRVFKKVRDDIGEKVKEWVGTKGVL